MRIFRLLITLMAISLLTLLFCLPASAQAAAGRKELKRVDFAGAPNMEQRLSRSC